MITQSPTQKQATPEALQQAMSGPLARSMRTRSAAEVLGILDPRPVDPMAAVPAGYWKTGWLPKPEGAAS